MHQFNVGDVSGEKMGHREKATDIEVQQSQSFEINDEDYGPRYQQAASQNHQQGHVYEDPVPVIVLRVPGPQKYALHLQALLQQYLEIRAAQFIKALEHQERQGHLLHPQHYSQPQQQVEYIPMVAISPMYHHQQYYQLQPQQNAYQQYYQAQSQQENQYQVPTGEQSYYQHHQPQALIQPQDHQQPQALHQPHSNQQFEHIHQQAALEYHHEPVQDQAHVQEQVPQQAELVHEEVRHEYHHAPAPKQTQELPTSYINFVTPGYDQREAHAQHEHHLLLNEQEPLETSENYPSDKHTQVIFKKKKNKAHQHSAQYHRSQPIVVAEVPSHHQQHQEEVHYQQQAERGHSHRYTNIHSDHAASEPHGVKFVTLAQESKEPINYHVIQPTLAPTIDELQARHKPTRMAPFTKEQFEKARRMMMNKSKRNRGSTSMRHEKVEKLMVTSSS